MKHHILSLMICLLGLSTVAGPAQAQFPDALNGFSDLRSSCSASLNHISVTRGTWFAGSVEALERQGYGISVASRSCSDGYCTLGLVFGFALPNLKTVACDSSRNGNPMGFSASLNVYPGTVVEVYLRDPETGLWQHGKTFTGEGLLEPRIPKLGTALSLGPSVEIALILIYPELEPCPNCGTAAIGIRNVSLGPS